MFPVCPGHRPAQNVLCLLVFFLPDFFVFFQTEKNWEHSGREGIRKFLPFPNSDDFPLENSKIQFEFLAHRGSREAFFSLCSQCAFRFFVIFQTEDIAAPSSPHYTALSCECACNHPVCCIGDLLVGDRCELASSCEDCRPRIQIASFDALFLGAPKSIITARD